MITRLHVDMEDGTNLRRPEWYKFVCECGWVIRYYLGWWARDMRGNGVADDECPICHMRYFDKTLVDVAIVNGELIWVRDLIPQELVNDAEKRFVESERRNSGDGERSVS